MLLETYIKSCIEGVPNITSDRIIILSEFISIAKETLSDGKLNLNFICTHNSRRSQFSQVWASIATSYYGLNNINSYSGGTEATAFNINAVNALRRAGVKIEITVESDNPIYKISDDSLDELLYFSKTYDDEANPQSNFIAIMTCSDADKNCPFVHGASKRFKLLYDDPKVSDGTSQETSVYNQRCRQIATEILYIFSKLK